MLYVTVRDFLELPGVVDVVDCPDGRKGIVRLIVEPAWREPYVAWFAEGEGRDRITVNLVVEIESVLPPR